MQKLTNMPIRQEVEKNHLTYMDIAHEMGIHRCTLSIWLHDELSDEDEKHKRVMDAIHRLSS